MLDVTELQPGLFVSHPAKPDWGLGKVIHVDDGRAYVYFKDVPGSPKDAVKALNLEFARSLLSRADVQSDPVLDNLPPMVHAGKVVAPERIRLTEQQAVHAFVSRLRSFEDSEYLERERNYKWKAHREVVSRLLSTEGRALVAGQPSQELSVLLRELCQTTNLLAKQEMMALNDGFKDLGAARQFAQATVHFIDRPEESTFTGLVDAAESLPQMGNARVLSWPIVTLLPYLGTPTTQMFLKPVMTKAVAEIFCFDLLYDARPAWPIYRRLLTFSDHLLNRLRSLGARDLIDVQSFMWVVVGYAQSKSQ
jgi:hypothetical protein